MGDLTKLPHHLDLKRRTCRVIIETPKGSRNKFNYDPQSNLFELGGIMPEGMMFPFDFGFVPSTLGEDGDPLDVLVLMDAPAHVGCLLDIRIIGVICAEQMEKGKSTSNDRLLGVAEHSYSNQDLKSIAEMNRNLLAQIEEFFVTYNKQRGKKFNITGTAGPKKAMRLLQDGAQAHKANARNAQRKKRPRA
jgi:inorganic pyrophosphatase